MLYKLLFHLSDKFTLFNLLRYITFRSIAAFFTTFLIGVFLGPWFIKKLRALKVGQSIRNDGPESHLAKAGTPTMGGVIIIFATLLAVLLWARLNFYVWIVTAAMLFFGLIGFFDDFLKVKEKDTKGVSAQMKLVFQGGVAFVLMLSLYFYIQSWDHNHYSVKVLNNHGTEITNVVYHWEKENDILMTVMMTNETTLRFVMDIRDYFRVIHPIPITALPLSTNTSKIGIKLYPLKQKNNENILHFGWQVSVQQAKGDFLPVKNGTATLPKRSHFFRQFYLPYYSKPVFIWPLWLAFVFYIFTIVAFSNATNLSDGLDGLASGLGLMLYLPFGVFAYIMGNAITSEYLLFPYIAGAGELTVFISAMTGGLVAFLWYNVHPAQIFMGDTGSLALGGVIATIAIILKQEVLLVIAGGMFVIEALSVMLQVFWYKRFKRRIFKMSPIHHHFELSGWAETQVVARFWILAALFAIVALSALKIR